MASLSKWCTESSNCAMASGKFPSRYDLTPFARKTRAWAAGSWDIGRFFSSSASCALRRGSLVRTFIASVRSWNLSSAPRFFSGSVKRSGWFSRARTRNLVRISDSEASRATPSTS